MAKMGRPKAEDPRKNRVMIRFTDTEYQKLKKCAEESNLTITETVRKGVEKLLDSKQ